MVISRQEFQLLGTTSLFIAAKYEEVYPPEIREFVYITDDSFTNEQILKMEKVILEVNLFLLHITYSPIQFLGARFQHFTANGKLFPWKNDHRDERKQGDILLFQGKSVFFGLLFALSGLLLFSICASWPPSNAFLFSNIIQAKLQ